MITFLLATLISAVVIHIIKHVKRDITDALDEHYKRLGE